VTPVTASEIGFRYQGKCQKRGWKKMTGEIIDLRIHYGFERGHERDQTADLDDPPPEPEPLSRRAVWCGVFVFLGVFWGCTIGAGLYAFGAF
jgi:hypothetical protein